MIRLGGAQSRLSHEEVGEQRDRDEDHDRGPVLWCGRIETVGAHVEVRVDGRADHCCRQCQAEAPTRGYDEHTEKEHGAVRVLVRRLVDPVNEHGLECDQAGGDDDAQPQRRGLRTQKPRHHAGTWGNRPRFRIGRS
jgi:hypothetical protein